MYKVIRYFRKSGRRKVILWNVSLEIAQLHCKSCFSKREGVWFDGYEKKGA
jgi:hypothetical protein